MKDTRNIQRLDRLLSNFGYGARSEVKKLVKKGVVKIDGNIVKDASFHLDPQKSRIEVNSEILDYKRFIYIMMNKPAGVISATYDKKLRTAVGLLPEKYACFDLFPAGRLDIDTEGLLLLTNDGRLAHELLSPRKHVPKRYYTLVNGTLTDDDVKAFGEGVVLDDGYKTLPAGLELIKAGPRSEAEVVLREGKFRQVKRMFEAVGKKVIYLKRIRMGGLNLDETLRPGECRELTPEEVGRLKADKIPGPSSDEMP